MTLDLGEFHHDGSPRISIYDLTWDEFELLYNALTDYESIRPRGFFADTGPKLLEKMTEAMKYYEGRK